jgi:anti-anti-sigma factor
MDISVQKSLGTASLTLDSRFDMSAIAAFRRAYDGLLADTDVREVVVDFSQTSFMDSSALGMLLLLRDHAGAAGKTVSLAHCNPYVMHILDVAQFGQLFPIR